MTVADTPGFFRLSDTSFAIYKPIDPQPPFRCDGHRATGTVEPVPEPPGGFTGTPGEIMRQAHGVSFRWRIESNLGYVVADLGRFPDDLFESVIVDGDEWHVGQGCGVQIRDEKWCWFAVYETQAAP